MLATSVPNDEFDLVTLGIRDELQVHVDVLDMLPMCNQIGVSLSGISSEKTVG